MKSKTPGSKSTKKVNDARLKATRTLLTKAHTLQREITSSAASHDVLELAVATAASQRLSHWIGTPPVWMIFVGVPSSDKTNTITYLRATRDVVFVDSLTENGLASAYTDPEGKMERQDLLSRLKLSCLVIKDLTTLFSMRPERVRKLLGELSSIFDGEFIKPSGMGAGVAWDGHFSFIGCVTPQCLAQHYRYMGRVGSRFLLYRIPRQTDAEHAAGYERLDTRRKRIKQQLGDVVTKLVGAALSADIAVTGPDTAQLGDLAEVLAMGRATAFWKRDSYSGDWELEDMQVEEPYRIYQQLRTLSHVLALIHGRAEVTAHEMALIRRVVLSTIEPDRAALMLALRGEALSMAECEAALGKSYGTTDRALEELARVGLIDVTSGLSTGGRPGKLYRLAARFVSLFPDEDIDHDADLARVA